VLALATAVVFFADVAVDVLVDAAEADLTTCVLPVAMIAVSTARAAVDAAAVQRVSRRRRWSPAARARRRRVCSSFTGIIEPARPGTSLGASCETAGRADGTP